MFRGLGSWGQDSGEGPLDRPGDMPPSSTDETSPAPDAKNAGGLASVFKGLAGAAKLTKSPPTTLGSLPTSVPGLISQQLGEPALEANGLPSAHVEALEKLKDGTETERIAAASQLRIAVNDYPLNPVLDIWYAAKELIDSTGSSATRAAGWELVTACTKHPSSTDLERKEFFQAITAPANPEDFYLQLEALVALSNNGRELHGFDYDILPVLTNWLGVKFASVRAARKQAGRSKGKAVASGEDKDFASLFAFLLDVIKFNFSMANDSTAEALIDAILDICMNTSNEDDLKACIKLLDAIVTFGTIPNNKLKDCVQILSSIHSMVPSLHKDSWHTLSILCRSHNGQAVVRILLRVLSTHPGDAEKKPDGNREVIREVRGAISTLIRLVSKSTEKGYPPIPYSLLVEGLSTVAGNATTWKIQLDILRLINVLFADKDGKINNILIDEDWSSLFDIVAKCSQSALETTQSAEESERLHATRGQDDKDKTLIAGKEVSKLVSRIEGLLAEGSGAFLQRQDCIILLTKIHQFLPDSAALLILDYFKDFRCCFPSDSQWETNLELVLSAVFSNRERSPQLRIKALQVVTEVYDMVELVNEQVEPDFVPNLVRRLLSDLSTETDTEVLREVVAFTAGLASSGPQSLFTHIVDTLRGVIKSNRLGSPLSSAIPKAVIPSHGEGQQKVPTPSKIVTDGYVTIFLRVMYSDVTKAARLYSLLVSIAKSNNTETDARLSAMKLLFRLRSDWQNRIFVTPYTESAHLATTLYRTEASLAKKHAADATQSSRLSRGELIGRPTRGISFGQGQPSTLRPPSGNMSGAAKYDNLWLGDEADVLPEPIRQLASPVLFSQVEESISEAGDQPSQEDEISITQQLSTSTWLEAVVDLIHKGCDWEVYSYILVYLPSQLSNRGIFRAAVPHLQELRRVLCEQIRTNSFQEPPLATGLRKVDVAICLLQMLTMLLSYHEFFQKPEEDDIVNTFVRGLTWERSAKCCIHALSICCYELPMSTSKALVTILQKMAQIVTQPYVAMHILEFLACLSRLPSLYVNFREDEHRIVFGICFRYLQSVREKKQANRKSAASDSIAPSISTSSSAEHQQSPNATEDLPQYVYALAYHVITFWFLALKLPDRANHVGWIAKNLFVDVDGSTTWEEQAQITIDFMQRMAYADVDESAADPLFTPDRYGPILKKRWLAGNSIVTIEQATSTGWAQVTKRQPSGTSFYMIRESFKPPPAHQEQTTNDSNRDGSQASGNTILPSHILVNLLSAFPQFTEASRPIPLPDDDTIDRALRLFDNSSTVDGHKVGVIYIGEGQTEEAEILGNIAGSADYMELLNHLGTLTKLRGATFNPQGLDRQYGSDGEYTFCWRDRVTEIVFHVTTQMPTNREADPNCNMKKRHIGNDFVNIIFNDSGLEFDFDTFPSDFNYVNVVITPESRASFVATRKGTTSDMRNSFYKVQVLSKPGFPEISPASDTKVLSLKALPGFIRFVALNASVFCLVWSNRAGGEHVSPWRHRLREIMRLREKYGPRTPSLAQAATPSPPGTAPGTSAGPSISATAQLDTRPASSTVRDSFSSLRRSSVATFFSSASDQTSHNPSHRSSMLSTAPTESTEIHHTSAVDSLIDQIDFSKWA